MKLGDIFDDIRNTEIDAPDLLKKRILERLREEVKHDRTLRFWKYLAIISTIIVALLISYFVFIPKPGNQLPPSKQENVNRRPKPEFVIACNSLGVGTTCSYTSRDGALVKGTCIMVPIPTGGEELACSVDGKTVQRPLPPRQ
ncbi:MAG: hypothetical protein WCQ47_06865 [bacterium]